MNRRHALPPSPQRAPQRKGFTLIELLVVIAIIGILISLLLPGVQQARAAARRMKCANNLKQLSLATHSFHDTNRAFPPARLILNVARTQNDTATRIGMDEPSWLVRLLPYLEQAPLHQQWDEYKPYGTHPASARNAALSAFLCPEHHSADGAVAEDRTIRILSPCGCPAGVQFAPGGAVTDYVANHGDLSPGAINQPTDFYWGGNGTGVIISSRPDGDEHGIKRDWLDRVRMADVLDGTSNTILIGEPHVPRDQNLTSPYNGPAYYGRYLTNIARIGGPGVPIAQNPDDPRAGNYSFGSRHVGIVQFALTDGSVRAVSTSISTRLLGRLTNRSDGGVVDAF
ncbi:MAG: DUF1559 domain-containing protein [Fuerstiella sp.]